MKTGTLIAGLIVRKPALAQSVEPLNPAGLTSHAPTLLPPIAFTDAEGTEHALADYRGRPVVLHLWATWCGPCITELPALAALFPSFDAQGITLLPVALDHGGAAKVAPFLSRLHLSDFSTFYDPRAAILAALEEESLPLTLLVDRNGEEIARHAGPVSWQAPGAISTVTRLFR